MFSWDIVEEGGVLNCLKSKVPDAVLPGKDEERDTSEDMSDMDSDIEESLE